MKCSYCGSHDYGKGCRLNPTSNIHIRGSVFNDMYKESVQSYLDHAILLKELQKPYTEFQCYKLGVIDENGNKIKTPSTLDEQYSFTPLVRTIIRLKKYLGSKVDLLEASNALANQTVLGESVAHHTKFLVHQDKIEGIINSLYQAIEEAYADGIPAEDVKKLIKA